MKIRIAGLMIVLLLLLCASAANAEWQSIDEIRATTPQRWTQTYETEWRTVTVDVPISIPAVDAFPVFKVRRKDAVDESLLTMYPVVENYRGCLMVYKDKKWYKELGYGANVSYKTLGVFENGAIPDILPEENDMPYAEALQLGLDEINRLFDIGADSLSVRSVSIDRLYSIKNVKGQKVYVEPYGSYPGSYSIYLDYLFDGIPMKSATNCYDQLRNGREDSFVDTYAAMTVVSQDVYDLTLVFYDEFDKPYDDVPICSFADAKAAFEEEIMAGHLRSIDEVQLCYIPYSDKNDKDVLWLLPAWYVKGGYTRNSKKEFTANYDDGIFVDDGMEHLEVVYQANIGKLIDYNDTGKYRREVPQIITWDQVR